MHQANILDPVKDQLDSSIFNFKTPKPSIVQFIKRLYYRAFSKKFGIPPAQVSQYVHLVLTGSLTTYQYSVTSDCDVAVFPAWEMFQSLGIGDQDARRALVEMNIDFLDGTSLPGSTHPMQFFTVSPGITFDDQFQPGLRSGFDLDAMTWVVPPEESRSRTIQNAYPDVFERASDIADKMKLMLDNGDAERAVELWKQVHKKRQEEQRAGGGDYAEGNIVYKWLVHEGLVDRLRHELGLQITTHVKQAVEWDGGELDPRILDNRDTGMDAWERLEQQVIQLAQTYDVKIEWLPRNMLEASRHNVFYDGAEGFEPGQLKLDIHASFPHITGEQSYFAALHEIGHGAWDRLYQSPFNSNSQEEELWAWHFALENSQIAFDQSTLEWAKSLFESYNQPSVGIESDTYPGWLNTYDHRQVNRERARGDMPPFNPNYPAYSAAEDWGPMKIDQLSEAYEFQMPPDVEQRFVQMMECPECHHHLRNVDGKIYCEYCGWQPRTTKVAAWPQFQDDDDPPSEERITFTVSDGGAVYFGGNHAHDEIEVDDPLFEEAARGDYDPTNNHFEMSLFPDAKMRHEELAQLVRDALKREYGIEAGLAQVSRYNTETGKWDRRTATKEDEWYQNPDIADWQHGLCDTYAKAMLDMYPHLRLGTLQEPDTHTEHHYFVHDDTYAYDSLGRHPLPYNGIVGDLEQVLDDDPKNYGIGSNYPYGENGGPDEYKRAKMLILAQHPWLISNHTKRASSMHIMYDFEKDRITLGSKDAADHSKMIGTYDPKTNAATLYEAERQWVNPTYFRRLWNYSYPRYPLKSVLFQAGDTTHDLKTLDHPYHERDQNVVEDNR